VIRALAACCLLVALVACDRDGTNDSTVSPAASTASPAAARVPAGVPPSFSDDVGWENVPAAALVPLGAHVTGSWGTSTAAGDAIVAAWEMPRGDPFRRDRGVVAWRRFADGGAPWRPVWGMAFRARADEPVLGIDGSLADVTGDGSADALVTASIGGSGACATVYAVDLAAGRGVYRSRGCDRVVEPWSDAAGLHVREAVYGPGDPHCCPSGFRDTVLVYANGVWQTSSSSVSPA
jgi:hypothetical protein